MKKQHCVKLTGNYNITQGKYPGIDKSYFSIIVDTYLKPGTILYHGIYNLYVSDKHECIEIANNEYECIVRLNDCEHYCFFDYKYLTKNTEFYYDTDKQISNIDDIQILEK